MPADLGAWPPDQARLVVAVLRTDGIDAATSADGEAVRLTVPDRQVDAAHAALVANMDLIAAVGRSSQRRRREREAGDDRDADSVLRLPTLRLRRLGRVVAAGLVGLLVAVLLPAPWQYLVLIGTAVAVAVLATRRPPPHDD